MMNLPVILLVATTTLFLFYFTLFFFIKVQDPQVMNFKFYTFIPRTQTARNIALIPGLSLSLSLFLSSL